jgi:hypothetical protein
MGRHRMKSARAHDIGRADKALWRAEVDHVANLLNGPAHDRLDTVTNRAPHGTAAATGRFQAAVANFGIAGMA